MNAKQDIINGLQRQIKDEEAKKLIMTASIDRKIKSYQEAIENLERSDEDPAVSIGANGIVATSVAKMTLKDAVKYVVLNDLKGFESSETIAHIVSNHQPKKSLKKISEQVSGILSFWRKHGQISKYQFSASKKDSVWGRNEWIDEVGEPKKEYFTNPKGENLYTYS